MDGGCKLQRVSQGFQVVNNLTELVDDLWRAHRAVVLPECAFTRHARYGAAGVAITEAKEPCGGRAAELELLLNGRPGARGRLPPRRLCSLLVQLAVGVGSKNISGRLR